MHFKLTFWNALKSQLIFKKSIKKSIHIWILKMGYEVNDHAEMLKTFMVEFRGK